MHVVMHHRVHLSVHTAESTQCFCISAIDHLLLGMFSCHNEVVVNSLAMSTRRLYSHSKHTKGIEDMAENGPVPQLSIKIASTLYLHLVRKRGNQTVNICS